jgi:hypothetical protein
MKNENTDTKSDAPAGCVERLVVPLPCPFCGSKPKVGILRDRWGDKRYQVACKARDCGVNPRSHAFDLAGHRLTRAESIAGWNVRHTD